MYVLGIDLAQHCGIAVVEVLEPERYVSLPAMTVSGKTVRPHFEGHLRGRVVRSQEIPLMVRPGYPLYDDDKLPNACAFGSWLHQARENLCAVMRDAVWDGTTSTKLIALEVPDDFALGFQISGSRSRRPGRINRASSAKTIGIMLRLSAVAMEAYHTECGGRDDVQMVSISPRDWQQHMLDNVPLEQPDVRPRHRTKRTKSQSVMAAWFDLGFYTDNDNIADAALLACYAGEQKLWALTTA